MDIDPRLAVFQSAPSPLQRWPLPAAAERGIQVWIKRDDLIGGEVQGNKWRKLKFVLQSLLQAGEKHLASFGGPYSNHVHALAAACFTLNIQCTLFVRGYAGNPLSETLQFCVSRGARLVFLSKADYAQKTNPEFLSYLHSLYGPFSIIPEGGTSEHAFVGVGELVREMDINYSHICLPVGTAGTMIGICRQVKPECIVLGFSSLKGPDRLTPFIQQQTSHKQFLIIRDYQGNGYGHLPADYADYARHFFQEYHILLDPVYTVKMMKGLEDMICKEFFPPESVIVAIHTGGIQGWCGFHTMDPRFIG